jgi:hypothetical protein
MQTKMAKLRKLVLIRATTETKLQNIKVLENPSGCNTGLTKI